jgi:hypothetical protein
MTLASIRDPAVPSWNMWLWKGDFAYYLVNPAEKGSFRHWSKFKSWLR